MPKTVDALLRDKYKLQDILYLLGMYVVVDDKY